MQKKHFIFFCTIAVIGIITVSCVTFSGRVAVKGNEPHTYIVLITEDTEYSIVGDLAGEIRSEYQNKIITVTGKIVKKAIPGKPAELEVYKILKVETVRE